MRTGTSAVLEDSIQNVGAISEGCELVDYVSGLATLHRGMVSGSRRG
jgi:hypothetical protein